MERSKSKAASLGKRFLLDPEFFVMDDKHYIHLDEGKLTSSMYSNSSNRSTTPTEKQVLPAGKVCPKLMHARAESGLRSFLWHKCEQGAVLQGMY